ncbi:MAG TPA: Smr/MutS family protein [Terriglobia bacterium]
MDSSDRFSLATLEFNAVLAIVGEFLSGPISKPRLAELAPSTEIDSIRRDLARVGEARRYLAENARPAFSSLGDPRPVLEKLSIEGLACESLEILALTHLARAAQSLRGAFESYALLDGLASALPDFRDLLRELEGKIAPDGSVNSSTSAELGRVRRAIERLRHEIQVTIQRLLGRLSRAGVLQDDIITIRNDRLVIPIRADEKRRVDGVVHGMSASGATVYLEPLETVPLNNELVEMEDRELAEVRRILGEFTERLRLRRNDLNEATATLAEIDLIFAKAGFGRDYDCCLPEFAPGGGLNLEEARHPLLEKALRGQDRRPVPLTLRLDPSQKALVISGPNTGGKTVVLKTIGLAALMAQSGLPVPALIARLPVFGRVLADIGDLQSIEASLSTFSAHIANIRRMVEVAGSGDLVLADELGGSTDPEEGSALAVAILEHFRSRGALAVVTTHQSRLKAYAAETPGAVNAAMEFDDRTLESTYRLLVGLPGKSSGLSVAERLGLAPGIVARARELVAPEEREISALVETLHRERGEVEARLRESERARQQLEARRQELERHYTAERRSRLQELGRRLEETLKREGNRWEGALEEIRAEVRAQAARSLSQGQSRSQFRMLEQRLERLPAALAGEARQAWKTEVEQLVGPPEAPEPPVAPEGIHDGVPHLGDVVQVEGMPGPGTVTGLSSGEVEVEVGRMRMRLDAARVRVIGRKAAARASAGAARLAAGTSLESAASSGQDSGRAEVPPEINVIGQTAEEAREHVDEYLDQAFVSRRLRLRVIHGHGKGILRRTLHEMFQSHPHVERFYPAPQSEGGTGATIVELKV